jgi:hypothetical protein
MKLKNWQGFTARISRQSEPQ